MKFQFRNNRGQFALEYILLFAATLSIIGTLLLKDTLFPSMVANVMDDTGDIVEEVVGDGIISGSDLTLPPYCGDGDCNGNEDCSCFSDCRSCATSGDGNGAGTGCAGCPGGSSKISRELTYDEMRFLGHANKGHKCGKDCDVTVTSSTTGFWACDMAAGSQGTFRDTYMDDFGGESWWFDSNTAVTIPGNDGRFGTDDDYIPVVEGAICFVGLKETLSDGSTNWGGDSLDWKIRTCTCE